MTSNPPTSLPTIDDIQWVQGVIRQSDLIELDNGKIELNRITGTYSLEAIHGTDSPKFKIVVRCLNGLGWKRRESRLVAGLPR